MTSQFIALLKKEFLVLTRDINGLLLLFAMPIVFIVIMSLAMQQNFESRGETSLSVMVYDKAANADSALLLSNLSQSAAFDFSLYQADVSEQILLSEIKNDAAVFLITISPFDGDDEGLNTLAVKVLVAPATNKQTEIIFVAALREALRGLKVEKMLKEFEDDAMSGGDSLEELAAVELDVNYAYDSATQQSPTAVQQNVPAWLVFAMFFVVVPLSNALIKERDLGTLRRLQSINVSPFLLVVGKLVPYFVIMQLQVVVMLLVGVYVVPLLGGDSLSMGDSIPALVLMAVTLSIGALGYAAVIAVICKTTEQATTLGGAGNIILAALGGVMVPKFVMPQAMQRVSEMSPMGWGLEGFLDVFLRNGDLAMVWPKALALLAFGLVLLVIALLIMGRQQQH